jgi:hypothetical protein
VCDREGGRGDVGGVGWGSGGEGVAAGVYACLVRGCWGLRWVGGTVANLLQGAWRVGVVKQVCREWGVVA